MNRILWILAGCMVSLAALAADTHSFSERVQRAKALKEQPKPAAYIEKHVFPALQPVQKCLEAPGTSTESFTVVADITKEGKIANVDTLPQTDTAQCFATALRALHFPPPPVSDESGMPIVLEVTLEN